MRVVNLHRTEDPEHLGRSNLGIDFSERERCNNCSNLSAGGREAVSETTDTSREGLGRNDEGRCVGTEVEKELKDGEASDKGSWLVAETIEGTGHNPQHQGGTEEANELDRLASNVFNSGDRRPVTGQETSTGDDEVTDGVVMKIDPVAGSPVVSDRSENDRLVKVDAVEGDYSRSRQQRDWSEKENPPYCPTRTRWKQFRKGAWRASTP